MSTEPNASPKHTKWWGTFRIPHGSTGRWDVGPMVMCIQRLRGEWRLATAPDEIPDDTNASVDVPADVGDFMETAKVNRFGCSGDSETVTLTPLLADRSVVTKPEQPFYIPARETVTVYVGTPLWIRVTVGDPPIQLADIPIIRLSDTWFGPATYGGELCYASRTACRLRLEEIAMRPHRAVTAVEVTNATTAPLLLERMKLPVTYLSLFHDDIGVFWTRDVTIKHEGSDLVPVRYGGRTPKHAATAKSISQPRQEGDENLAVRVFWSIFR